MQPWKQVKGRCSSRRHREEARCASRYGQRLQALLRIARHPPRWSGRPAKRLSSRPAAGRAAKPQSAELQMEFPPSDAIAAVQETSRRPSDKTAPHRRQLGPQLQQRIERVVWCSSGFGRIGQRNGESGIVSDGQPGHRDAIFKTSRCPLRLQAAAHRLERRARNRASMQRERRGLRPDGLRAAGRNFPRKMPPDCRSSRSVPSDYPIPRPRSAAVARSSLW